MVEGNFFFAKFSFFSFFLRIWSFVIVSEGKRPSIKVILKRNSQSLIFQKFF